MSKTELPAIAQQIWEQKYRALENGAAEATIEDTWLRVANVAAQAEAEPLRQDWAARFRDAMSGFEFLPAGRILSGAGTRRKVTLFNCFVMGTIGDDIGAIFEGVKEAALTMQQGGGIGYDFSTLRPQGAPVKGVGADASGPVSFMDVWNAMCRTIMSAGSRRGAMMATLACDHPDIEAFIAAKADPARLRMFNLSVLVSDAFMEAVERDASWDLVFDGKVYKTLPARALWDKIMRAAYAFAEPGVIFIDRINRENNLSYCETIRATNPCGEQPLPPYGACLLGSINLAALVRQPFTAEARLDEARLCEVAAVAVRFLDNVIDISGFPHEAQRAEAMAKRRIGLGITGLADALILCGAHYGSDQGIALAGRWMAAIQQTSYRASAGLAAEKGCFPLYDAAQFMAAPGVQRLDEATRQIIAEHGMRNGLLTSIAPTGTISLLAGNVSSGIEPVFDLSYTRRILTPGGEPRTEIVEDHAYRRFRAMFGAEAEIPDHFVTAQSLTPAEHLRMQSALQPHVDASISKTVNCPEAASFPAFQAIYKQAYALGLKGCTVYRPNAVTGSVLIAGTGALKKQQAPQTAMLAPATMKPEDRQADIVYMAKPLERDPVLSGATYKLKWADSDHAIYVTINDIVQDSRKRPFEIFINSKNLEHYAWTVALTRMISAVFRRGGDVAFVVEELKAVFDPRGGQWMGGRYVPSLLAAIGDLIEKHMLSTGFLQRPDETQARRLLAVNEGGGGGLGTCPRCGAAGLVLQEGCLRCRNCGFSKCS